MSKRSWSNSLLKTWPDTIIMNILTIDMNQIKIHFINQNLRMVNLMYFFKSETSTLNKLKEKVTSVTNE